MRTKRLRIFAGPNGSGKSVLYSPGAVRTDEALLLQV